VTWWWMRRRRIHFGGLPLPFWRGNRGCRDEIKIANEPAACPTLTRGAVSPTDFARHRPQLTAAGAEHTLAQTCTDGIHAGGLADTAWRDRTQMLRDNLIRAEATPITMPSRRPAVRSQRGHHPGAGSSTAIKGAIDAAKRADGDGTSQAILFNLSTGTATSHGRLRA